MFRIILLLPLQLKPVYKNNAAISASISVWIMEPFGHPKVFSLRQQMALSGVFHKRWQDKA